MAQENKQLKQDFLSNMTTTTRPYMSAESKNFASSMLQDTVDNSKEITFKSSYSETNFRKTTNGTETKFTSESYTIHSSNGVSKRVEISKENGEMLTSPMKSFIQQRVERLYGPGALAQGFFNQKRYKLKSQSDEEDIKVLTEKSLNTNERIARNDLPSPSKDEHNLSLPVLRHLRPEFRAQLPILSPKKSKTDVSPQKHIPEKTDDVASVTNGVSVINIDGVNGNTGVVKDGHYFLEVEKRETERLIALAATADKELEALQDQDVSEEVLGFLRSASGKARLLATQKMQQFEGLCYNNINEQASSPFPTTNEDLQGFWDMVRLQVDNVDEMYRQMAELKANGWKEITPASPVAKPQTSNTPRPNRNRTSTPTVKNEKARLAAEKREADRKAMLDMRRRVAKERQLATRATNPGTSQEHQQDMGIEGGQEVEIFVGKQAKSSKVAPQGDCNSRQSEDSLTDQS